MSIDKPKVKVLCIYGSPRIKGNTDLLMDAFADGVESAGGEADRVYLRNLKFSACREIYACERTGNCALKDDMTPLYDKLKTTHSVALAAPIMFYTVPAVTKAFMDRCQAFWCVKYRRGESVNLSPIAERKGVLLTLGGSKGKKLFDGVKLTFKYFLETFDAVPWKTLAYRQVDERGDIAKAGNALSEATEAGRELVESIKMELREGTEHK